MIPFTSSKINLGVVTAERERASFFSREGSFFAHVPLLFRSGASESFCIFCIYFLFNFVLFSFYLSLLIPTCLTSLLVRVRFLLGNEDLLGPVDGLAWCSEDITPGGETLFGTCILRAGTRVAVDISVREPLPPLLWRPLQMTSIASMHSVWCFYFAWSFVQAMIHNTFLVWVTHI